ncbi:MAG: type II toxin-antitoxin system VapC family toxin [Candidatus Aenigmarchaeota archaeon]|nr:type II toxin-antitoxin system VapC family toxin [Candidatus Aenigmarchaeota archaeon]
MICRFIPWSTIAADIFAKNRKTGRIIDVFDVLIASICIAKDEKIITRNISDFSRIPQLKIER